MLRIKGLVICFYLVWQYSSVQTKYDKSMFKVMATYLQQCTVHCSDITLSPASFLLCRELKFCNGYLSLLYFCFDFYHVPYVHSVRNDKDYLTKEICNMYHVPECLFRNRLLEGGRVVKSSKHFKKVEAWINLNHIINLLMVADFAASSCIMWASLHKGAKQPFMGLHFQ